MRAERRRADSPGGPWGCVTGQGWVTLPKQTSTVVGLCWFGVMCLLAMVETVWKLQFFFPNLCARKHADNLGTQHFCPIKDHCVYASGSTSLLLAPAGIVHEMDGIFEENYVVYCSVDNCP